MLEKVVEKVVGPLKKSLDLIMADILDPWEKIHSETDSVVGANEERNLEPVSKFYCMPLKHRCMVLGACTHAQIISAHIWPKHTYGKGLDAFELSPLDVNNPRNFLRLHNSIEKAFDRKRLTFVPVSVTSNGELKMKVIILDPALLNEDVSYNQTIFKFSTLHDMPFDYVFGPTTTPYTRLLSAHTLRAYSNGKMLGWPDAENFEADVRPSVIEQARRSLGDISRFSM